jgi:hypothetical protein
MPATANHRSARPIASPSMTLLLLEALGALVLLVFIVWWTMFSGRKKGELPDALEREKQPPAEGTGKEPPAR